MATCTQTIESKINDGSINQIYELQSDDPYDFVLSGTNNVLIYFQVSTPETVQFTTRFLSSQFPVNVTATVFFYNSGAGTVTNLGSSQIFDTTQSFQQDLQAGEYILCFRTQLSYYYNGTVTGFFTQYQHWANLFPVMYTGETARSGTLEFEEYGELCPRPVRFYMTDGYLPEGLTLNSNGQICGTVKNLDCIDYTKNLSPSVDWFYEHGPSGQWFPQGLTARFKVRVEVIGYEDIAYDEKWFCIRVYNDWSQDMKRLLDNLPMHDIKKVMAQKLPEPIRATIPDLCSPCPTPTILQPEQVLPQNLCPCQVDVDMIPIPAGLREDFETALEENNTLLWWQALLARKAEMCCHELEFVERLEANGLFLEYISSLMPEDTTEAETQARYEAMINEMNGFMEIRKSTQVNGRNTTDIDHVFLQSVYEQNQKLEMEFRVFTGESAIVDTSIIPIPLFNLNFYTGEITKIEADYLSEFWVGETLSVTLVDFIPGQEAELETTIGTGTELIFGALDD